MLSILPYLNSRDCFSENIELSSTSKAAAYSQNQLLEAISLIKLIARYDLMVMFQELLRYLSMVSMELELTQSSILGKSISEAGKRQFPELI